MLTPSSPPLQHLRYKMIVKLMAEESSATDPTTVNMSDYSSISSSEGDYTDPEAENKTVDDYFLFQNVRRIARRKRRKMAPEEYQKTKEKKKLIEYVSESESSSDDDYIHLHPSSAYREVSVCSEDIVKLWSTSWSIVTVLDIFDFHRSSYLIN